jgi:hypothetical protein
MKLCHVLVWSAVAERVHQFPARLWGTLKAGEFSEAMVSEPELRFHGRVGLGGEINLSQCLKEGKKTCVVSVS